jgi:peptidoglycan/LPS O-acetylase OafA/YrhL
MPTYGGILLADITSTTMFRQFGVTKSLLRIPLVIALFVLGTFLMSYPSLEWDWSPQYRFITHGLSFLFPLKANIYNYCSHVGMFAAMTSIALSPFLQKQFSRPLLLWLGEHSLAIYLVHGPLIRSVFCWIAYSFTPIRYEEVADEEYNVSIVQVPFPPPSLGRIALGLPVFVACTILAAILWNRHVEPLCANIVKKIERVFVGDKESPIKLEDRETERRPEPNETDSAELV